MKKKKPKKKGLIIDIELHCGCKYQHHTNNSQHKYWTHCNQAATLWNKFINSLSIEDRNKYFEHYENSIDTI